MNAQRFWGSILKSTKTLSPMVKNGSVCLVYGSDPKKGADVFFFCFHYYDPFMVILPFVGGVPVSNANC